MVPTASLAAALAGDDEAQVPVAFRGEAWHCHRLCLTASFLSMLFLISVVEPAAHAAKSAELVWWVACTA